jgi:CRP-like cAMP-binding protein
LGGFNLTTTQLPTPETAIRYLSLEKGTALFLQGDKTFAIFAIRRGRIRLVRHLADGNIVPLHVAHTGQTFSEAALYSDFYHCDAIADLDSEIEVHPKEALSKALDDSSEAAHAFTAHLAKQVIALRSRLEIRNIRSAEERVMQFLRLEVTEIDQSITFSRPLKDIANDIGLTHEVFYRTLSKLESSGALIRTSRTIKLQK